MIGRAGAIAIAAAFTASCMVIQSLPTQADKLTAFLIVVAVLLGTMVVLAAMTPTATIDLDVPDLAAFYGLE